MTSFFTSIGHACTSFFKHMPALGNFFNYFIILTLTVATFFWIGYMLKNPQGDANYLSKK